MSAEASVYKTTKIHCSILKLAT